jgi:hypothetical protein
VMIKVVDGNVVVTLPEDMRKRIARAR